MDNASHTNGPGDGDSYLEIHTPVLIIGAGPSGATTALLLGQLGIPSVVVSRHRGTADTPRAHIFNQRAMEVLRQAGLEERLRPIASPTSKIMHTSWLHSLTGEEYGRVYAWGNKPDRKGEYEMASPCIMSDLPQSLLEPVLVEEATEAGAEFRFYSEYVSHVSNNDGTLVTTTVRDRHSDREYKVYSRFLIGADGASSKVLENLGIPVDGKQLNTAFNVHIKADLSRFLQHRPGSLNWILNPDAPEWSSVGNIRMVRPWSEFVVSMHPANRDTATFEPKDEDILKRLYQMIGTTPDELSIEMLSRSRWTINDQVARQWQKQNVICIGDATHRHPPNNGLGSNTCINDAMNIAWKLAFVLKGIANSSILESITVERKPVGDAVVRRANEAGEANRHLWSILGLNREERQEKTELLGSASPEGAALRQALGAAIENTDDEMNALGMQMNQRYCNSPLVTVEAGDNDQPDLTTYNLIKDLIVSTYPGYHLPHVWIAKNGQSYRESILDLCERGTYTLFTGIGGGAWKSQAKEVERQRPGLVVRVVSIGFRQDYMDAYGDWAKVRGVDEDGAVLVRPDQFVAWRCKSISQAGENRLVEVLQTILPSL